MVPLESGQHSKTLPAWGGSPYLAFRPLAWVALRFAQYAFIRWLMARFAVALIGRRCRVDLDE